MLKSTTDLELVHLASVLMEILGRSFSLIALLFRWMTLYTAQLMFPPLVTFVIFGSLIYFVVHSGPFQILLLGFETTKSVAMFPGKAFADASMLWCSHIGLGCTGNITEAVIDLTASSVQEIHSASKVIGGMRNLPSAAEEISNKWVRLYLYLF